MFSFARILVVSFFCTLTLAAHSIEIGQRMQIVSHVDGIGSRLKPARRSVAGDVESRFEEAVTVVYPDGTSRTPDNASEMVAVDAGLHVVRTSISWWERPVMGDDVDWKKVREVILSKPFVAQPRGTLSRASASSPSSVTSDSNARPIQTEVHSEGIPRLDSDSGDLMRLYIMVGMLGVLFLLWSRVTGCRTSGR